MMAIASLPFPTIETDRLILRGWREDDVPAVKEIIVDEEASRFIGGVLPPWQAFRVICLFIGHWQMRGFSFLAVEEKASGECIGWCGMWRPDGWPENEIGYSFRRAYWGRGYASEAAAASLRFAYEKLGWQTAISCIDQDNKGSQGVAKRLGAGLEETGVEVNYFTADIWRHLPPEQYLERFQ